MTPRDSRIVSDTSDGGRHRRRKYLVDTRMQLASTMKVAGLVLVLLVILNSVLAWQNLNETRRIVSASPHLSEQLHATEARNMAIFAAISLIILAMVVVRSIMLTHRTAGAMHKIIDLFEDVAAGDYDVNLRLRQNDTLRALEDPFNKMVATLHRREQQDTRSMTKLADEISEHGNPVDAEMLRRIADSKSRKLS